MTTKSAAREKSRAFALRMVKSYRFLQSERKEYVLSKQLLRSGVAIGALVREAEYTESRADFVHKQYIALKEASETDYWIDLLCETLDISIRKLGLLCKPMPKSWSGF